MSLWNVHICTYDQGLIIKGKGRMYNAQWACRVDGWFLARCVNHSVSTVCTNETDVLITEYKPEHN